MDINDIIKGFKLRIMKSAPRGYSKVKYGNGKNQFILIRIKKGMAEAQILNNAIRQLSRLIKLNQLNIKRKYMPRIRQASKPEKQVLKSQMTNEMQKIDPRKLSELIRDKTILENLSKSQKKEMEIIVEQKEQVSKEKQQAIQQKQEAISEKEKAQEQQIQAEKEKQIFKDLRIEYKRLKTYADKIALPYSIIYKFHRRSPIFESIDNSITGSKKEGIIKFLNSNQSDGFKRILDNYNIKKIDDIETTMGGRDGFKRAKFDAFKTAIRGELIKFIKPKKTPTDKEMNKIRVAQLKEQYDTDYADLSNDKTLKETLTNIIGNDLAQFWADVNLINELDYDPTNNNNEVAQQLIEIEQADAEPAGPLPQPEPRNDEQNDNANGLGYLSKAQLNGGLYESELNKIMERYPSYLGTFAIDELKDKALSKIEKQSQGSLIINLSPRHQPGSHWVCIYFDARPGHKNSIEYYDSFAEEPPKIINQFIRVLADKLDAKSYIPLKINFVKQQNDNSYNCGYWSMNFLINRYNNRPYSEASYYDERSKEDDTIKKFEKKYVESFGAGITWDKFKEGVKSFFAELKRRLDAFFRDIHKFNPSLKRILTDDLNPVTEIQVVRQPIQKSVAGLLNFLSGGQIDQNLIKNGYDSVFHLSALIKTKNPETGEEQIYKTQKNPQVELKKVPANFWLNESQQGQIVAGVKREFRNIVVNKKITIGEMFEALLKKYDETLVAKYTTDYNCQWFITELLKASNLGNSIIYDWILQDINKIFDANLTNLKKTSDIITNFKARLDTLFKGAGKPKAKKPVAILIKNKAYGKKQIKEILNNASYKPVVKQEKINGYNVYYYTNKTIKNKTFKKYDNNKIIMVYNR